MCFKLIKNFHREKLYQIFLYIGGAMFIHAFGAYFGLAVSMMHRHRNLSLSEGLASSRYTSDLFSLVSGIRLLNFTCHVYTLNLNINIVINIFERLQDLFSKLADWYCDIMDLLAQFQWGPGKRGWTTSCLHQYIYLFNCINVNYIYSKCHVWGVSI